MSIVAPNHIWGGEHLTAEFDNTRTQNGFATTFAYILILSDLQNKHESKQNIWRRWDDGEVEIIGCH